MVALNEALGRTIAARAQVWFDSCEWIHSFFAGKPNWALPDRFGMMRISRPTPHGIGADIQLIDDLNRNPHMARSIQAGDFRSSNLSEGRSFVYVVPCAYEDILKLGFSRDPIGRLRALHYRYFAFFDLERALLIETETVRDARKLELKLGQGIALHSAPAPLMILGEAAGYTEWYRGAYELLVDAARELQTKGFVLHQPAALWLRQDLIRRGDALFTWSGQMLEAIEAGPLGGAPVAAMQRTLRDTLDAYAALAIDLKQLLPTGVYEWYLSRAGST